jgi:NADH dehydrogenase
MKIFLLGGTGFVGKFMLKKLLAQKYEINLYLHKRKLTNELIKQNINIVEGDIFDQSFLKEQIANSDVIINLIGIIKEKRNSKFEKIHYQIPKAIIDALSDIPKKRYIHMSALGVSAKPASKYFESKLKAEEYIKNSKVDWTIFRPSIIWHENSDFVKQLNSITSIPFLTPVISPNTKFQPVRVEDIAEIFVQSINDKKTFHRIIEVGGSETFSFDELLRQIEIQRFGKKKMHFNIPLVFVKPFIWIAEKLFLPIPITIDQLKMLAVNNVVHNVSPINYKYKNIFDQNSKK